MSSVTLLYVVRHGETEWSRDGRHTSVTDLPLTEHGVEQARALNGHLTPGDFQLVLSSPRRRALQTAELAGFVGPEERRGLREHRRDGRSERRGARQASPSTPASE